MGLANNPTNFPNSRIILFTILLKAPLAFQIADLTENETKLCSKIKELQLRIDQVEFEMSRSKSSGVAGVLNHSSLGT